MTTDEREMRERAIEAFKCDMCAGSGQLMHYGRNHGPCHKCQGIGHDAEGAEKAAAFAAAERDTAAEECCKDVCEQCAAGMPVKQFESGLAHINTMPCKAAAIRARVAAKGEK